MQNYSVWSGEVIVSKVKKGYEESETPMYLITRSIDDTNEVERGIYLYSKAKEKLKDVKEDDKLTIICATSRCIDGNIFIKLSRKEEVYKKRLSSEEEESISLWSGDGMVKEIKVPYCEEKDMFFVMESEIDGKKTFRGIYAKGSAKEFLKDLEQYDPITILNVREKIVQNNILILLEEKEQINTIEKIVITADEYFN